MKGKNNTDINQKYSVNHVLGNFRGSQLSHTENGQRPNRTILALYEVTWVVSRQIGI